MAGRSQLETLGTLAHEMVHQWQYHHGKPGKRGHNREWAEKMKSIGLKPKGPGGKETGPRVSHEIVAGGPFEAIAKDLKIGPMAATLVMTTSRPRSHVRYICPTCGLKAYAKPKADLRCSDHGPMMAPGR